MSKYKISYNGWSDESSPIKSDVKVKTSHNRLVANHMTSERNKDPNFRKKVAKGVSKYYGKVEDRFNSNLVKGKNGCIEYTKRWIVYNGQDLQPKTFSALYHNLGFTKELIVQKCGNKKCVNPKHLIEMDRTEQAINMLKVRKNKIGDNHHNSKLSEKDIKIIKKRFSKLVKERNGKSKGIATIIHTDYPYVTLTTIINAIKK
jgi:hypothetical protein